MLVDTWKTWPRGLWALALGMSLGSGVCASEVYRCQNDDGSWVFQEIPCRGRGRVVDVQPASGAGPASPVAPVRSGEVAPATEAQRIEAQVAQSQRERRARDLRDHVLPAAQAELVAHRQACEARIAELRALIEGYPTHIRGRELRMSASLQMNAEAARCLQKDLELSTRLEALGRECADLACRPH
jgi:hypothetical protein